MEELWKDIDNYDGYYKISNYGRVMSLKKYGKTNSRIIKNIKNGHGYFYVNLCKDSKCTIFRVHQLVAMAFLGHKPDGTARIVIDHINNIKSDNRLSNLQLISQRENGSKDKINKTSGILGVTLDKRNDKWITKIGFKERTIVVGSYEKDKLQEAKEAYQKALKEIEQGLDLNVIYPKKQTTSKYKGVFWHTKVKKWQATIKYKGRNISIGRYFNEEDAKKAVDNAKIQIQNNIDLDKLYPKCTNKYKGLTFYEKRNKWGATVVIEGKRKYVGLFKTDEEAYIAQMEYLKNNINYVSIGN